MHPSVRGADGNRYCGKLPGNCWNLKMVMSDSVVKQSVSMLLIRATAFGDTIVGSLCQGEFELRGRKQRTV